ncbi:hypothetical protein K4F52_001136 [Lecanicillium sp. MT-2017a]|nr:hypothetical protein K4F52_001136 [Lecanicillium sp. MT-2017a]
MAHHRSSAAEELTRALLVYLGHPETELKDVGYLRNYLTKRLPFQKPQFKLPVEEMEEKVLMMQEFERILQRRAPSGQDKLFRGWHYGFFAVVPLETLRSICRDESLILNICKHAADFIKMNVAGCCPPAVENERKAKQLELERESQVQEDDNVGPSLKRTSSNVSQRLGSLTRSTRKWARKTAETVTGTITSSVSRSRSRSTEKALSRPATADPQLGETFFHGRDVPRNSRLKDVSRHRDQSKCVLSGKTGSVEVCHILPYASYATHSARKYQRSIWELAQLLSGNTLAGKIRNLLDGPGSAEKEWNTICLNPYLHKLFDAGSFALKPCGYKEEGTHFSVSMQYIQLYKTMNIAHEECVLSTAAAKYAHSEDSSQRYLFHAVEFSVESGHRIKSGNIFQVQHPSEQQAESMVAALQFRYNATMAQFLAGAAGCPYYDPDYDEDRDAIYSSDYFSMFDT